MGRTPTPPQPDPALGQAALRQTRIAEQTLALSRQQFATQREQDAKNYAMAQEQYGYQKGILDRQMNWAQQDRQRMEDVYRPLEDRVISDANRWDSAENMQRRAGQAQADVQQAIGQQNQAVARQMTNMGVNPNSGRFAGALRSQAFQNAALQAGAQNQTRGQLLNEAQAMRAGAVGMGNPLLGASYGANQSAGAMAGTLSNAQLAANQQANQGFQTGMQGMQAGAQANQAAFNNYNSLYQNQIQQWQAKMQNRAARTSAVLGLAGAAFGGPLGATVMGGLGQSLTSGTVRNAGENTFMQRLGWNMQPE